MYIFFLQNFRKINFKNICGTHYWDNTVLVLSKDTSAPTVRENLESSDSIFTSGATFFFLNFCIQNFILNPEVGGICLLYTGTIFRVHLYIVYYRHRRIQRGHGIHGALPPPTIDFYIFNNNTRKNKNDTSYIRLSDWTIYCLNGLALANIHVL